MYPVLVQLGTFELRSYGIIVALSFFLGLWLSAWEAKRSGLDPALVQDFAFYALLGGIIGALLGGFLTALWYCRKKQLSFWRFADTLAPGVALGQAAIAGFYILGEASGSRREL